MEVSDELGKKTRAKLVEKMLLGHRRQSHKSHADALLR